MDYLNEVAVMTEVYVYKNSFAPMAKEIFWRLIKVTKAIENPVGQRIMQFNNKCLILDLETLHKLANSLYPFTFIKTPDINQGIDDAIKQKLPDLFNKIGIEV